MKTDSHTFRWRIIMVFCLLFFGTLQLVAQRTVTGTVMDAELNEPLIGANVLIKGTSVGTITDIDGNYSIDVSAGDILVFSYTGYEAQEILVEDQTVIDVTMAAGKLLDEIVVIGYGTTRKGDATGAVNAVKDEEFNRGAIVSPDQLIAGKVAGVQITQNSGEPGGQSKVRIRGGTSINASNEPLYVIDGVPIDNAPHNPGGFSGGRNPLNFLNPADIETFTVLKDASATAIYGSRGANGVIIITTKKGKAGERARLSYDGYVTTINFADDLSILDANAFRNVTTFIAPDRLEQLGNANTNWFDQVSQDGFGHSHSLSFTGGAGNLGYRASLGYQNIEGVIRTAETERTSFSLNLNHSLLDEMLLINANVKGAFTQDRFDPGVMGQAWGYDPTQPVFDPSNNTFAGFFEYGSALGPRNPVSAIEQVQDFGKSFRNIGNIDLEYKFDDLIPALTGLSFKTNLGYDINNGERKRFQPTTYLNKLVSDVDGEIRFENFTRTNALLDAYLKYNRSFGQHRFDFTAGYSYQDFRGEFPAFRAFDLSTDIFSFNSTVPAEEFQSTNSVVENRLISFFGRVNYVFGEKYLLTATVRRDGSTRFSENQRWGWFPSFAAAWRISDEEFAQGLSSVFSDLKLRVGWGITGNQEIGDFNFLPRYTLSDDRARYQFGEQFVTTARPDGYDANLKWEETSSFNIGLDFGFDRGRINGTIDYYYKRTNDLLFTVNVPAGTNLTDRVLTNIGEVENQGVELTLNAIVFDKPNYRWSVSLNGAYNVNEILEIDRVSDQGILTGGISGGVGNNVQILQKGQPVNAFFLFQHLTGSDGNPLADGVDHNEDGVINEADIYADLNGDGMVNDLDKRPVEQPAPDLIFGITSQFDFYGFDLAFTLRGSLGNYVYNNNASNNGYFDRLDERGDIWLNNLHTSALVSRYNAPQYFSDFYLEEASFLRLDNITLGYSFGQIGRNTDLRVYATAQNLFVLTEYSGLDPEVDNGIDNNPFPRSRSFIFGVNIGL